jgi:hypothetical protein
VDLIEPVKIEKVHHKTAPEKPVAKIPQRSPCHEPKGDLQDLLSGWEFNAPPDDQYTGNARKNGQHNRLLAEEGKGSSGIVPDRQPEERGKNFYRFVGVKKVQGEKFGYLVED